MITFPITGKISTFGGPNDKGVSPSEGLALVEPEHLTIPVIGNLFLKGQPLGTTGLARRLNPSQFYLAMRWDYKQWSKDQLRHMTFRVYGPERFGIAVPVDWGPNIDTGRVADLSPGLAAYIGLSTDQNATISPVL